MAQQHHHDSLSQHSSQYCCSKFNHILQQVQPHSAASSTTLCSIRKCVHCSSHECFHSYPVCFRHSEMHLGIRSVCVLSCCARTLPCTSCRPYPLSYHSRDLFGRMYLLCRAQVATLVCHMLGAPPEQSEQPAAALSRLDPAPLASQMKHKTASHMVEAIFLCCPAKLYDPLFKSLSSSFPGLCVNPIANYAAQSSLQLRQLLGMWEIFFTL